MRGGKKEEALLVSADCVDEIPFTKFFVLVRWHRWAVRLVPTQQQQTVQPSLIKATPTLKWWEITADGGCGWRLWMDTSGEPLSGLTSLLVAAPVIHRGAELFPKTIHDLLWILNSESDFWLLFLFPSLQKWIKVIYGFPFQLSVLNLNFLDILLL